MTKTQLTLGMALAHIDAEIKSETICNRSGLSETDANYLQSLRQRRESILSLDCTEKIFNALPKYCCQTELPHLAENIDLFIARFLIYPEEVHKSKLCKKLSKHLNDCFRCFEEFCQVLRDYYHTTQELSKNS